MIKKSPVTRHQSPVFFFIFIFSILDFTCFAQSVCSTDLINKAKQYDGNQVTYRGEVIGEIMVRGNFAWINVNDGQSALGVWIDKDLLKSITHVGNYKTKGDRIEIIGMFNRSCREHGGDLDIHAASLQKIEEGKFLSQELEPEKVRFAVNAGIIFFSALGLGTLLKLYKRKPGPSQ